MSAQSVEPMNKPSRERDFDRAMVKKGRRFHKRNEETSKRDYIQHAIESRDE